MEAEMTHSKGPYQLNFQNFHCCDFMVDVETTGVYAGVNAMIQLSCVPFNFDQRIVSTQKFDIPLAIPDSRFWDPSTRRWWETNPDKSEVLKYLLANGQDPVTSMQYFDQFVRTICAPGLAPRFWMNRNFDWGFVQDYFKLTGVKNPFHHRQVFEMISFIKGLGRSPYYEYEPEAEVPFEGTKHNAIDDCRHQIKRLFWSLENVYPRS
jgi:3' exoribonuclease, RNase T-like